MKKLVFMFVAMAALTMVSCGDKTAKNDAAADTVDTAAVDTAAADTAAADTAVAE